MMGLLAALVLLYALAVAWLTLAQDAILFRPYRRRVVPADAGLRDFSVIQVPTTDGLMLDGWYRPADAGLPTIVLLPGNAGHPGLRADKAAALAAAGYGVLIAGYRGYAGNPGSPSLKGLLADAAACLDYLVERGISGQRVVLYGESLGTGFAIALAAQRRVARLILESPFTSLQAVAQARYPWAPVGLLFRHRLDCRAAFAQIRAPILILHGRADRTIPVRLGEQLEALATVPVRSWRPADAGHTDLVAHGAMAIILAFLADRDEGSAPESLLIEQKRRPGPLIPRR